MEGGRAGRREGGRGAGREILRGRRDTEALQGVKAVSFEHEMYSPHPRTYILSCLIARNHGYRPET